MFQVTPARPFGSFAVCPHLIKGLRVRDSVSGSSYSQEVEISECSPYPIKVSITDKMTIEPGTHYSLAK